ncbi:MAG: FG-GAP repeat protein [Planctomycetes bacterium]|nr:FG-GAP repeat protein [Planctomycetota bacterium]
MKKLHGFLWSRAWALCAASAAATGALEASPQSPSDVLFGVSPQSLFGYSVTGFSDFDGDGREDFAVSLPCDNQRGPLAGAVKVFTGPRWHERLNLLGSKAGDLFGSSLARIGDLDCDGVDELLVGAPGASPRGRSSGEALVFSGSTAEILFRVPGSSAGDECGFAVCAVGDLDGDGRTEFAVGSPGARFHGRNSGVVRVYDGADLTVRYSFFGAEFGERFGAALAGPGDMDGDGIPELAVGAPCPRLDRPGYVRVLAGRNASVLATFGGQRTWEQFGTALCGAGDTDGDGHADLLVGSPLARPGAREAEAAREHACGAVTLFSGRTGRPRFVLASQGSEDRLGTSVALGPDLNGDGLRDLLAGAPQRYLPRGGYVQAFSAADGTELATWIGAGTGDQFGAATAALAVTGPGQEIGLVLVGAPADKNLIPDGTRGVSVGSVSLISIVRPRP